MTVLMGIIEKTKQRITIQVKRMKLSKINMLKRLITFLHLKILRKIGIKNVIVYLEGSINLAVCIGI